MLRKQKPRKNTNKNFKKEFKNFIDFNQLEFIYIGLAKAYYYKHTN